MACRCRLEGFGEAAVARSIAIQPLLNPFLLCPLTTVTNAYLLLGGGNLVFGNGRNVKFRWHGVSTGRCLDGLEGWEMVLFANRRSEVVLSHGWAGTLRQKAVMGAPVRRAADWYLSLMA